MIETIMMESIMTVTLDMEATCVQGSVDGANEENKASNCSISRSGKGKKREHEGKMLSPPLEIDQYTPSRSIY